MKKKPFHLSLEGKEEKQQHPTAIFSVYAPSDIQWLEQWEAHLHLLEQAGLLSVWSAYHLQVGFDRQKSLYDHLDQADLIVLLLSADFFTDDECITLVERALARHQQGTTRLIPLLLRPVAFRETKLSSFTPIPSNGHPVTLWENPEAAFDDCVRSLRRILGRPVTSPLGGKSKRPSVEEQNRERMLQRLRRTYEELFAQSLQGVTQMELGLADKPDAVQNATTLLLQISTHSGQLLPSGTSILHVYDEAMHELLILGAPGAGKSTLLVELARQLVGRVDRDVFHPLPVILPISSWAVKRSPLETWLAEQVARIYYIQKKVARQWINEDQLLPLLDGLDEMDEAARPACIAAINTYHRDHLRVPLVVCSRQAEYEEASKSQRLALQNAVMIQPLTHEYIQTYLARVGKPFSALRRVITANSALAETATTPLMMHVLTLTYQGTSVRQLSTQREQLQQQVWTDYVQRMVERKRDMQHYPSHQIIVWLSSLARQMRDHNQSIFYLEQLQPDWLPKWQRGVYRLSIGLVFGLVFGIAAGLLNRLDFGLLNWPNSPVLITASYYVLIVRLVVGPVFGLPIFGLVFGLIFGLKAKIEPAEVLKWSWRNLKSRLVAGLFVGLFFWLVFEVALFWITSGLRGGGQLNWLDSSGLVVGLSSGLVSGLSFGFSGKQLIEHLRLSPNEGIQRSLKNGLAVGLAIGLISGMLAELLVGLVFGLLAGMLAGLLVGLVFGLVFGLLAGLGATTQHYTLRLWLWRTHAFPWKAQQFLDDAVTCILLRRVGGGYSFVHRLLLDHFADLPAPTSATHSPASRNSPPANNPST